MPKQICFENKLFTHLTIFKSKLYIYEQFRLFPNKQFTIFS